MIFLLRALFHRSFQTLWPGVGTGCISVPGGPWTCWSSSAMYATTSCRIRCAHPLRYYDIQKVFSLVHEDGKSRRTLEHAVDFLGLEKSMPFHDALCDAWYTAQVLKTLPERTVLHNYSYDYFRPPASKKGGDLRHL